MRNPLKTTFRWIASVLAEFGIIDAGRGRRTADLSWPRMLTGFARLSQRTADVAMIGIAVGPAGIAGVAIATVYWGLGNSLSLGLAGGTISQVSQRYGAGDPARVDLAVKQSVWVGVLIALPFTLAYWTVPVELLELLTDDPATISHGSTYLSVLSIAMVPNFMNTIASRTLAGADDTWIPMSIRSSTAVLNVVFNAVLIFGMGLGVLGAAVGTVLAEAIATAVFSLGFLRGGTPLVGSFPVRLRAAPPYFDSGLSRRLLVVATPLMGRRLAEHAARFPLFAILALFGPTVVAAYEVSRRIRNLMNAPAWGFAISATSLVGQALGEGDEDEANAYGWDILRFSFVVYLAGGALVFAFARPITLLFVQEPGAVAETVPFVRVAVLSLIGKGIDGSATGVLRATGDTRWPLYGKFAGLWLVMLPLAYLGAVTPLGLLALYMAYVAETAVPAGVSLYRFWTGKWRAISRSYSTDAAG